MRECIDEHRRDAPTLEAGYRHGVTDDHGVEGKVHIHDLHATMLHLLGLDHDKLTYRYSGRDWTLTDLKGKVVKEILTLSSSRGA